MANMNHLWNNTTEAKTRTRATVEPDGAIKFKTAAGNVGTLKPHPEHASGAKPDAPMTVVDMAWQAMNEFADAVHSAKTNHDLSTVGRQNAVAKAALGAITTVAVAATELQNFRRSVDLREQRLYAVPELSPAAAGLHIRDMEARQWFAGLDASERASVLAAAPEELMLALQRGPVPQHHHITKLAREVWQRTRRELNVTEAEAIDAQRIAADWAFEQLALIASIVKQLASTWGEAKVLETLMRVMPNTDPSAYLIYGFTDRQAATVRRQHEAMPA